jgi:small-conductance mechanosensitive channel
LAVVIVAILTLWLARLARHRVQNRLTSSDKDDKDESRPYGVAVQVVIWAIGAELGLHLLGIQLSSLIAAGGFVAIAGGLAAKDIAENMLAGTVVKAEKLVRPGDLVIVDSRWLYIVSIGLRSITAKTGDGEEVVMPNSTVTKSTVENLTRDDRLHRIQIDIGVALDSDMGLVRATLEQVVAKTDWRSEGKDAVVHLQEFTRFDAVYRVSVWIDDVLQSINRESDLREAAWRGLKDAGITIA